MPKKLLIDQMNSKDSHHLFWSEMTYDKSSYCKHSFANTLSQKSISFKLWQKQSLLMKLHDYLIDNINRTNC